jgi:membrane-associated phospholipid phosphatase
MNSKLLQTTGTRLIDLDDRARQLFEPYTDTKPVRALDLLSKAGDQPELRVIAGSLLLVGTLVGNDRLVRAGSRMLIAHEAATVVKDMIKTNIDRTRPRSANNRDAKKPKKGDRTAKEKTSFPSGHSAGAIAAARAFSREFPEYGPAAIGGAALVAALQVPRCAHYPTDVAAGLLIGLVVEGITNAVWDRAEMDRRSVE